MESLLVSALQSELAHASSEGRTGQASWLINKRLINTYCVEHSVRFCMLPVQSLLTHHSSAPVSAPSPPLLILAYVIFTVERPSEPLGILVLFYYLILYRYVSVHFFFLAQL